MKELENKLLNIVNKMENERRARLKYRLETKKKVKTCWWCDKKLTRLHRWIITRPHRKHRKKYRTKNRKNNIPLFCNKKCSDELWLDYAKNVEIVTYLNGVRID